MATAPGPLAGIGVIEIGAGVAVRYCARLFAQLGATVLSVRSDGPDSVAPGYAAWLDARKTPGPSVEAGLAALAAANVERRLVICGQDRADVAAAEAALAGLSDPPPL